MASSIAAVSSVSRSLDSVPWLEEALLIASMGVAFILAHKISVASRRRTAKAQKLVCAEGEEEEEQEPCCHSEEVQELAVRRDVRNPERRARSGAALAPPKTSAEMPGVTDRRFVGRILSFSADAGYGFIACHELYPFFRRDVFLHKLQVGIFGVGADVCFSVFLNKHGQPQAKDLEVPPDSLAVGPMAWGGYGPCCLMPCAPAEPVLARRPLNPRARPFEAKAAALPEESPAAAEPDPWSAAEPEATWTRRPSAWKDFQGGQKRWAPKAQLQWVPKRNTVGGAADEQ